ncbi:MAG: glucose 1-dehydrogenase [Candidatus Omnitrophica bacterium]|nr:glucose 1-dehydrogenase [Candidatus Omnitrophota bacterium]
MADWTRDLAGKRTLVTGATRGIGEAIAEAFSRFGAKVAITGRKPESLEPVAARLSGEGGEILPIACHNGRAEDREALFQKIQSEWGGLDVIVNNAATNPIMAPLAETSLEAWEKIQNTNVTGPLNLIQKFVPGMAEQGSGSIVNIASVAGLEPAPGLGAYSVSKAALLMLTKVLARELGGKGIRCNAIAPGLIETKFSEALFQSKFHYEKKKKNVPLGRHGQPEELVEAVCYLASETSSYMTGQVLVIDGGSRV